MQNKPKRPQVSYQEFLDLWPNEQIKQLKKNIYKTFVKTKIKVRNFWQTELKGQKESIQSLFFVQKAVALGASRRLPFTTLELLGKKLAHPAYKEDISKIIQDNVIKYSGNYYKLDDLDNQSKIQKAIRRFKLEECSQVQNDAA